MALEIGGNAPKEFLDRWDPGKTEELLAKFRFKFKIFLNIQVFLILTVVHLHYGMQGAGRGFKRQ